MTKNTWQPINSDWNYPTNIKFGAGRIQELPGACTKMNISKPCIVTDSGLATNPMLERITNLCLGHQLSPVLYSQVKSNPTGESVTEGVSLYKASQCDGVIALGGGSALDAGKAIALMVGQKRPIWDFEDIADHWTRVNQAGMAPCISIPTTAGTGSEVGRASVITDTKARLKKIIFHPKMMPALVILDPELTVGLPAHLTAATGMDALSHLLEAYCSPGFHPMADGIAIEGMRLIKHSLPSAFEAGEEIQARSNMLVASTMGATAFQKGLGAMHALAHPLGALYDAHHGLLNAILMPYVLKANQTAITPKITPLCDSLNIKGGFNGFLDWVLTMRSDLNIQHQLKEIGINEKVSKEIGKMAIKDPSATTNPVAFTENEYENIFLNAVEGRL